MLDILDLLRTNGIQFERFVHEAVYTCEEARKATSSFPGKSTKNLFLRDGKGTQHFLVVVSDEKRVDLKHLESLLEVKRLGMASAERLKRYLGVEPGAVTILGLANDTSHAVRLIIDQDVWESSAVQAHPLINTETLVIPLEGVRRFIDLTGHQATVIALLHH